MSSLTSLLVRDQRVTVRKIEEAIQRQVIVGGGLDTVLLELGVVPEDVMAAYCAAVHGLLPATRDEVMRVPRDHVRVVPREVAERHQLVPLSLEGGTLVVAVTAPLEAAVEEQLASRLGVELVQRIVVEARLVAGLHHHYDVEMSPRMRRLTEKLRQREPGVVPFVAPPEPSVIDPEPRDTVRVDEREDDLDPRGVVAARSTQADAGNEATVRVGAAQVVGVRYASRPPSVAGDVSRREAVGSHAPSTRSPSSRAPSSRAPSSRAPEKAARGSESSSPPSPQSRASRPRDREDWRASLPRSELLRKHRGPLTARRAVQLLGEATDRDTILEMAFAFTRQFFDTTALFLVHEDSAEAIDVVGPGVAFDDARRPEISLDAPGAFALVREGIVPLVTHLDQSEADRALRRALGRDDAMPAVLVPVAIRQRVVLVLYGDRGGDAFGLSDVPELIGFAPRLSEAFQHLILRLKRGPAPQASTSIPVPAPEPVRWSEQGVDDGRSPAVPAQARSEAPASEAPASEAPTQEAVASETSTQEAVASEAPTQEAVASEAPTQEAVASETSTQEAVASEAPTGSVHAASTAGDSPRRRPRKRSEAFDVLGIPREAPPPPVPAAPPGALPGAPPRTSSSSPPASVRRPSTPPAARLEAGTYRMHGGVAEEVLAPKRRDPRRERGSAPPRADVVQVERVTPLASRETLAPAPRPSASPPADLPSVIVEVDESVEALVHGLRVVAPGGAEEAVAAVIALGEVALPVLVRDFPGPLWFDRQRPHRRLPRGRDVSAVARGIAAYGDRAVPYVASLLDRDDVEVRFYATLLASEFPHRDLVAPLGRRVFDDDARVAALALDVLASLRVFEDEVSEVLQLLRATARVPRSPAERRARATYALGELRDVAALELLVALLEAHEDVLAEAAHRALVVLTRQDFGLLPERWDPWVAANKTRHRIEWLIDGLVHADEELRRAAGDELKQLTQEYFGYHPALPKRDREVAQRKYRRWWETEGHQRFAS